MKPIPASLRGLFRVLPLATAGAFLAGCVHNENQVVAGSGTLIGLQIGQAPADTTPQLKFGYSRAEIAFVPTNRGAGEKTGGAQDTTDVLMELNYSRGGTRDAIGGIYQRLAVGRTAVQQGGAAVMFAKKPDGSIDENAAKAVQGALGTIPKFDAAKAADALPLHKAYNQMKPSGKTEAFDEAAKSLGFASYQDFVRAEPTAAQVANMRAALEKDAEIKKRIESFN